MRSCSDSFRDGEAVAGSGVRDTSGDQSGVRLVVAEPRTAVDAVDVTAEEGGLAGDAVAHVNSMRSPEPAVNSRQC